MYKGSKIYAPASKSYFQRAMAIASLTKGVTVLKNVSWCDDTLAVKLMIRQLGSIIREKGRNLVIESNGLILNESVFNAGESGLALRMFAPVLSMTDKNVVIRGDGSLKKRPAGQVTDALYRFGVGVSDNNGFLPLKIKGPVKPGIVKIDGSLTSQVLTGLLIALPLAAGDSEIIVDNLKSKPYIDMTLEIINYFGVDIKHDNYQRFFIKGNQKYKATDYSIEGDWSGAAFFLVAGAVSGEVEVLNLDLNSKQADKRIIDVLKSAGADVVTKSDSVIVKKKDLEAFEFDATDCPDLFPPLVCLAAACKGTSVIKGVSRLKHKESDRAAILQKEFGNLGLRINIRDDLMEVTGGKINISAVDSHGDHRIAMAAGVMSLLSGKEIVINGEEAVNKSYPGFFDDLKALQRQ